MDQLFHILEFHWDLAALGAILTFLTVLFTFYTKVATPMYNVTLKPIGAFLSAVASSPGRIDNLDSKLDIIISELKPNGGTSLKDQLNRLESSVSIGEAQRLLILDSNTNGIWTSSPEGKLLWINNTLKQRTGFTLDEMKGDNWINVIWPADRSIVQEEWTNAVKNQRAFNLFYRLLDTNHQVPINVHGIATPAKNYEGSVVGFNGIIYFL